MNRHKTHQIDESAQTVLRSALALTWVVNEQHKDYGKDYLTEIGEDNGDLTGISFYIQLKGQERAKFSRDRNFVKCTLDKKYADYYHDRVEDLPVFLVVVDVNMKRGWWLFLQAALYEDQSWRARNSVTLSLPVSNDIFDKDLLRKGVQLAKEWIKEHAPGFRSKFLQQCFDYICAEHGLTECTKMDSGMLEEMLLYYFPSMESGVPCFDPRNGEWDFVGGSDDHNLQIGIYSNGRFTLRAGDDDFVYLDLLIKNPEEIGELLLLIENLGELGTPRRDYEEVKLADLITLEAVLILYNGEYRSLRMADLIKLVPEAESIIDAYTIADDSGWEFLARTAFPGWHHWCKANLPLSRLSNLCLLDSEDLIYSESTGLCTYRRWLAYDEIHRGYGPPFIITRNRRTCSILWLHEYCTYRPEGQGALKSFLQGWKQYSVCEKQQEVGDQASVLGQIRFAVEARMLRGR